MEKTNIKIAFLSTYPPNRCGIATFTKSLMKILDDLVKSQIKIIAVSDNDYLYSPRVIFDVKKDSKEEYLEAAKFINSSPIEVVVLEHEYGIFGGEDGEYILEFLNNVNRPIITAFHSVLLEHSEHRKKLTKEIINLSNTIIVMTKKAKQMLISGFKVDPKKIKIIEHGVPNVRFDEKDKAKEYLGLKDRKVLTTFGLLNRGKGIEIVIKALKDIVPYHPELLYLVIGVTHPSIVRKEGESYREMLEKLVKECRLEKNVHFINRYLDYEELVWFLRGTDVYVSPQLDLRQAFSGTLSYAIGCGCTAVSTPTTYAQEILAANRGYTVPADPLSWKDILAKLMDSEELLQKTAINAYRFGRKMIWQRVGMKYLDTIEEKIYLPSDKWLNLLPNYRKAPNLSYLEKMTTKRGIIQHSKEDEPDMKFGYSLDDQARALIAVTKYLAIGFKNGGVRQLARNYFSYLEHAVDNKGIIHNFFDKNGRYADDEASDDAIARSFWALAYYLKNGQLNKAEKKTCQKLIKVYRGSLSTVKIKPIAYSLLGYYYLDTKKPITKLANRLLVFYKNNMEDQWHWFEDKLTWASAIIPYALLKAYQKTKTRKYLDFAIESSDFLDKNLFTNQMPEPVGNGWWEKGSEKSQFDQQPIEVADQILLYNELFKVTKKKNFRKKAVQWLGWYYGNNIKKDLLIDQNNGGVFDGLTNNGINKNKGAESIVTYLMAHMSFRNGL